MSNSKSTDVLSRTPVVSNTDTTVPATTGFNFGKGLTSDTAQTAQDILDYMRSEAEKLSRTLTSLGAEIIRPKQNKHFILPNDETVSELEIVLLSWITTNTYYDRPFSPDAHFPPVCGAINTEVAYLAPQENAPKPQHTSCDECPKNQFKSGANGRGKACRNARRIAFVLLNGGADVSKAPLYSMECPPTSIRHVDRYIQQVTARFGSLPFALRTKVTLDKEQAYSTFRFETMGVLPDDDIIAAYKRIDEGKAAINTPINFSE